MDIRTCTYRFETRAVSYAFYRRRKRGTTISAVIVGNFHFSRSDSLVVKKRNETNEIRFPVQPTLRRSTSSNSSNSSSSRRRRRRRREETKQKKRENFDDAFSSFVRSYNTTNRGIPPPFSIRFHSYGVHVPFLRNDQNVGRYKRRYRFFFFLREQRSFFHDRKLSENCHARISLETRILNLYTRTHAHTYIHIHTHVHTHICIYTCIRVRMHIRYLFK